MDALLIIVTTLALTMAAALAVVVGKLFRDERRRSDARVVALAEMSAEPRGTAGGTGLTRAVETAARASGSAEESVNYSPVNYSPVASAFRRKLRARVALPPEGGSHRGPVDDLELRPANPSVPGVADLFSVHEQPSAWGRRATVIAALCAVVVVVGFALRLSHARSAAESVRTRTPQTAAAEAAPLELLSLRHTQPGQNLVITGLVENPRGSAPLSHVVATAFVFGPDGQFLASGRAPLDVSTLTPGDESPFVVTVPVTGPVARYRVGFRGEDGRVIAHIDKRVPDAIARK